MLVRIVLCVLCLLLAGIPVASAEQPDTRPPKLDVAAVMRALESTQIYRAPGAVARFDEDRVRAELSRNTRILVAPYTGRIEPGGNYADFDEHYKQVDESLEHWAKDRNLRLITVEGIHVGVSDGPGYGPSDIPGLRQTTAYLDVTEHVLVLARLAGGMSREEAPKIQVPRDAVVQPSDDQVSELAGQLQRSQIRNAPGRDDPITLNPRTVQEKTGFRVRIAALATLDRGQPLVDYAPVLAARFPGDVVMVAQGRWLDVAGPDQAKIESARNYAYGRFEIGSFTQGSTMDARIGTVLERLNELVNKKPFGRPQPPAQPRPELYDVRRTISAWAPWVLLGSAVVLGGAALVGWRLRSAARLAAERSAMRTASAEAFAKIGELGARLLKTEERGGAANPAAAERHATARTLFDQAHTPEAMAEVEKIADEGLALRGARR